MEAKDENSTMPSNGSFARAAVEIINGPFGKDAIRAITIISVSFALLSTFCIQRGYVPSVNYGHMSLAFLKA